MGMSSDGILFFGLDLGEEDENGDPFPWADYDEEMENEEYIASKLGVNPPEVEYEDTPHVLKIYEEYAKKCRELAEQLGCEIDIHCSFDYAMYYVCLADKNISANRGSPVEVPEGFFTVTEAEIEKLQNFCKLLEIPWKEPKFIVASLYG